MFKAKQETKEVVPLMKVTLMREVQKFRSGMFWHCSNSKEAF